MTFHAAFYKSVHTGVPGIYNRLVRWWTRSQYSHVELVFPDGLCASASYMDGGVRFKQIEFDAGKWDFVKLPPCLAPAALVWFQDYQGASYDLLGNLHFIISPIGDGGDSWFCSEAVAAALGIPTPARFDPGTLYAALQFYSNTVKLPGSTPSTSIKGNDMTDKVKPQPKEEVPQTQDSGHGDPPPKNPPTTVPSSVPNEPPADQS